MTTIDRTEYKFLHDYVEAIIRQRQRSPGLAVSAFSDEGLELIAKAMKDGERYQWLQQRGYTNGYSDEDIDTAISLGTVIEGSADV